MFYDPMIAKLVSHGPTRIAAIDAQAVALDAFYIDGIQHNIPFLAALMQHPRWREGNLSTGFIPEEYPEGFKPRAPEGEERNVLIAVAAAADHQSNARRRSISQQMSGEAVAFAKRRVVRLGSSEQHVEVSGSGTSYEVAFLDAEGNRARSMSVSSPWWPGEPVWRGIVAGKEVAVQVRPRLNGYDLAYRGIHAAVYVYTEREAELAALMPEKLAPDMSKFLLCPMPGLVKVIHAGEGQEVKAGDALAVVEAMKMENILRAERDGTVKKVNAKEGDSLAVDAVILEFA
jgi:propionyl-CoA carboxylase alpha chain